MISSVDVPQATLGQQHQHQECLVNKRINEQGLRDGQQSIDDVGFVPKLIEKSVIIHKDENGFGLRFKGQTPVYVEHVHENGAAWRAGVRSFDTVSKVNGIPVSQLGHKDVILMFKSCTRFVALTLLSATRDDPVPYPGGPSCLHGRQAPAPAAYGKWSSSCFQIAPAPMVSSHHLPVELQLIDQPTIGNNLKLSPTVCGARSLATEPIDRLGGSGGLARRAESTRAQRSAEGLPSVRSDSDIKSPSSKAGRRNLNDSFDNEQLDAADKRMAVCVFCRNWVSGTGSNDNNITATAQDIITCSQCQLEFSLSPLVKQSHGSLIDPLARPHITQDACGRIPQTKLIQMTQGGGEPVTPDDRHHHFVYKLTQSASANSLPSETNKLINNKLMSQQETTTAPVKKPASNVINKRIEIIREFIDTERTHTERLRCLDELFYRPIKAGGLMTHEQLRMVFSCHRTLYKIHRQIYRILLSANYNLCSEPLIGSALLEIFEGNLKKRLERASCSFCSAQATNIELLNKLTRRETKVGEFIAHVTSQQMVGRLGIKDLLASCFQRLTKYPLLLENLLKATPQAPKEDDDEESTLRISSNDDSVDDDDDNNGDDHDRQAAKGARLNSKRMLAISLAEEREFIDRALQQSRHILVRVNEAIKVAISRHKLKEIWKRTDKYPGVPLIDITKQQVVHEGLLTLRLSKRSFDVYVLLLNDYLIILTREGQDKYRLKFFTPEGKSSSLSGGLSSSSGQQQSVYSPVFVIDEHLTTRDAATDENGFYLLCKRKDDSRIYEFASRSPAERIKWRDRIQWTIERQMSRSNRRASCESTVTKSSSDISTRRADNGENDLEATINSGDTIQKTKESDRNLVDDIKDENEFDNSSPSSSNEPTKFVGTISYVDEDEIVMPSKMESTRVLVDQAIQVNVFDRPSLNKPIS